MIITVGGIKGGSGKTTVVTNLAVMAAADGREVLLVDGDDQETASDFAALRNSRRGEGAGFTAVRLAGAAVRTELLRLAPKHDLVLIDTGGRDTTSQRAALTVSNLFLVPFVPRSFDIWTLEQVSDLTEEVRTVNPFLKAFAFLNRADPRGPDNAEAAAAISDTPGLDYLDFPLGSRKAFGNAAASGLGVTELAGEPKAAHEMTALYRRLTEGN